MVGVETPRDPVQLPVRKCPTANSGVRFGSTARHDGWGVATVEVGIARRALADGSHCGDQGRCWQNGGLVTLCVVDGLGHGKRAEQAATAAVEYVGHHLSRPLRDIFAGCNRALWSTAGVAMGLCVIDQYAGMLTYAGIGNTRAMIAGQKTVLLPSDYGIVGGGYKRLLPATVRLAPGDLVILTTDGVDEKMELSRYNPEVRSAVVSLADRILEDWNREVDDAAVVVFRHGVA